MTHLLNLSAGSRRVFDALWRTGPSSRAEIADATGLTRPAVSQLVQELATLGLLSEQPARKGQRGQPARPIVVDGSAGYAIGVNFSHSYIEVGLVDLSGILVGSIRGALREPTPEAIAEAVSHHIDTLLADSAVPRDRLLGIGLSLPADFYSDGTLMPHQYFPGLRQPNLAAFFTERLGASVLLENDGRACAIGERVVGIGRRFRTFMLVHIGHGVGGGLIIDGKPYRGVQGNAGLMGQFYPYGAPRPSGQDLIETLTAQGHPTRDFDALENLPRAAKPAVAEWIARAAAQLSPDLARVGRFFGPEAIILAGRLPPEIIERLASAIDLRSVLSPLDDLPVPPVLASPLGSSAGMIGAASLPIFRALLPHA